MEEDDGEEEEEDEEEGGVEKEVEVDAGTDEDGGRA